MYIVENKRNQVFGVSSAPDIRVLLLDCYYCRCNGSVDQILY